MDFGKVQYTMSMTGEELGEAIKFYAKEKYGSDIKIVRIEHLTKRWTDGFGMGEMDYKRPDGLKIVLEGE